MRHFLTTGLFLLAMIATAGCAKEKPMPSAAEAAKGPTAPAPSGTESARQEKLP